MVWERGPSPVQVERRLDETLSLRQFVSREKEAQLKARSIVGIRAMDRVVLDTRCPLLSDCAFLGIGRIGRAHQLTEISNCVFFFERQYNNRPAGHELGQRVEESFVRVDSVELLRLMLRDLEHL